MTKEYSVKLTDIEDLALGCICVSQQTWIDNAVHEICRITIDNIAKDSILKCIENNMIVPQTKDEAVNVAIQNGWLNNSFNPII